MNYLKTTGIIALWVALLFTVIFAVNTFQIFGIKLWGVDRSNAQRQVFEQSQSYVEGKRQELIKYHHQWLLSTPAEKASIEFVIRPSFANFDDTNIEDFELRNFLVEIKHK